MDKTIYWIINFILSYFYTDKILPFTFKKFHSIIARVRSRAANALFSSISEHTKFN